jgi:hypothetical protein
MKSAERWAAAAGVTSVAVTLIGDAVAGASPPAITATPAAIGAYFHSHAGGGRAGAILTAAGAALFIVLFVAVAVRVRAAGHAALGWTALALIVSGNVLATIPDALLQSTIYLGDDRLIKGAYVTSGMLIPRAFWFGGLSALLVGVAALQGVFDRWYGMLALVVGPILLLGGCTVARSGFFAVAGPMTVIAFAALMVWVVTTSVVIWTAQPPANSAQRPSAAAAPLGRAEVRQS